MADKRSRFLVGPTLPSSCEDCWTVNLSTARLNNLEIVSGSYLRITGHFQHEVVRVVVADDATEDDVLGMDKYTCLNLRVKIGDVVSIVQCTDIPYAARVRISPFADTIHNASANVLQSHIVPFFSTSSRILSVDEIFSIRKESITIEFKLLFTDPAGHCFVNESTKVECRGVIDSREKDEKCLLDFVGYSDIGGLAVPLAILRDSLEIPFRHPLIAASDSIQLPKGILLKGPSGVGKRLLVQAVANEMGACLVMVCGINMIGMILDDAQTFLGEAFEKARRNQPAIILITEIEEFAQNGGMPGDQNRQLVAQLLTLMDKLDKASRVVVVATTDSPFGVDAALSRRDRFSITINMEMPSTEDRFDILQVACRDIQLSGDVDLKKVAGATSGFVGRDIIVLCRKAKQLQISEGMVLFDLTNDQIRREFLASVVVPQEKFMKAIKSHRSRALSTSKAEIPKSVRDPVGLYKGIVDGIVSSIQDPALHPDAFKMFDVMPGKGCVIFGPPGNGKTALVDSVAAQTSRKVFPINCPEVFSTDVGKSESNLRDAFQRAKHIAPSILLLDELDSVAARRGKVSAEGTAADRLVDLLLTELNKLRVDDQVYVIGTTNRIKAIDPAITRRDRLAKTVYMPMPDIETRLHLLQNSFVVVPVANDVPLRYLAEAMGNYTVADVRLVCDNACAEAAKESVSKPDGSVRMVTKDHFQSAMRTTRRTLNNDEVADYDQEAASLYDAAQSDFRFPPDSS